jgi:hypothetical protein
MRKSMILLLASKIPYKDFLVIMIKEDLDLYPSCPFGPFILVWHQIALNQFTRVVTFIPYEK